jgi:glycosyltransferase involved in cell wall biosynthesis
MKNKLVDILILNRDYSSFLKDAIDSCIKQTYRNINIIIADDNSTDASRHIIEEYCKKYTNITKIFIDDKKPNISKVRNILIQHAKSPFCCFLSSDDYYHEDFIKNSMESLSKNPHAYGIYSNFDWITRDKKLLSTVNNPAFEDKESLHKKITTPWGHPTTLGGFDNIVSFESSLFRKETFEKNIDFHEDILYGEESMFICEVTQYFFFMKNHNNTSLAFKRKHIGQGHTEYMKNPKENVKQYSDKLKECIGTTENNDEL